MRVSLALVSGVAVCLLGVAGLADRALAGRAQALRSNAALRIEEDAQLAAESVGLALARLEREAAAGRPAEVLRVERLTPRPRRSVPAIGFRPYAERSRAELIDLLSSMNVPPNGLPEAAVARIALGPGAPVSGPAAHSVEDRLLSGRLPVEPDDLVFLSRELGLDTDPRRDALEARLRRAPVATTLPLAPSFQRRPQPGRVIEGWLARLTGRLSATSCPCPPS